MPLQKSATQHDGARGDALASGIQATHASDQILEAQVQAFRHLQGIAKHREASYPQLPQYAFHPTKIIAFMA